MEIDEQTALADRIKAGKLKFTQKNLEKVQEAYCVAIRWNALFTGACLENLPDPEDIAGQEDIFKEWLVAGYVEHGRDEAKVRGALAIVRKGVLEQSEEE